MTHDETGCYAPVSYKPSFLLLRGLITLTLLLKEAGVFRLFAASSEVFWAASLFANSAVLAEYNWDLDGEQCKCLQKKKAS